VLEASDDRLLAAAPAEAVQLDWSCDTPGGLRIAPFSASAGEGGARLHGLCWCLEGSALVWLSPGGPPCFGHLAAAFPTRFGDGTEP